MDEITLNDEATSNEELNPVEATTPIEETPVAETPQAEEAVAEVQAAVEEKPKAVKKVKTEKATIAEMQQNAVISAAHDDFDWSVDKRNVSIYNNDDRATYDKLYEETFKAVNDNEMVNGTIVGLTKTDVVVNIGYKSDGLISLNEFRDLAEVKVGDEIEVLIVQKEDRDGHLNLSRKLARQQRAWERIVDVYKTGEIVTGYVTSKTKGGLIVDLYGMETFLPGSQIDVKPVTDYDQFVNKTMEFKVVKINEIIRNAVV